MNDQLDHEELRPPDARMIPAWTHPAATPSAPPASAPTRAQARHAQPSAGRVRGTSQPPPAGTGQPEGRTDGEAPDQRGSHPPGEPAGPGQAEDPVPIDDVVIRPFLLTAGRTQPRQAGLRVETLVQACPEISTGTLRFEIRRIVELCRTACSVAEIAAAMQVPIGVARVLVSDLVADGAVTLLQREELSVQLIERIRDRVRAL